MISDIVSFFVGPVFPPRAKYLGRVPMSSVTLHLIETGQVKVYEKEEQGVCMNLQEWNGYKWEYRFRNSSLITSAQS
jgi:hypothetical protein